MDHYILTVKICYLEAEINMQLCVAVQNSLIPSLKCWPRTRCIDGNNFFDSDKRKNLQYMLHPSATNYNYTKLKEQYNEEQNNMTIP